MESVLRMEVKANGTEGGKGATWAKEAPKKAQQRKGIKGLPFEKLSAKWNEVVNSLKNHGVTITNALHALKGSLSIRYAAPHSERTVCFLAHCCVSLMPQVQRFPRCCEGVLAFMWCVQASV